jgi:hypothetical protein
VFETLLVLATYSGKPNTLAIPLCEMTTVTPQVFGFHNCIAFHKHEHKSSHSCLNFVCNMSMQHTVMCLFHNLLAYEM